MHSRSQDDTAPARRTGHSLPVSLPPINIATVLSIDAPPPAAKDATPAHSPPLIVSVRSKGAPTRDHAPVPSAGGPVTIESGQPSQMSLQASAHLPPPMPGTDDVSFTFPNLHIRSCTLRSHANPSPDPTLPAFPFHQRTISGGSTPRTLVKYLLCAWSGATLGKKGLYEDNDRVAREIGREEDGGE